MLKRILLFLFSIMMFLYYLFHAIQTPANSDFAAIILEARSIYEGNIFLSGWALSTVSFYTTDIPFYVIGMMILGPTHRLLYIVPSIIFVLTLAAALWVVYDGKRIRGSLLTFSFIGIPVGLFASISLTGPIHIAAIGLCLICLKFLQLTKQKNMYYLYFGLLFCWTLIGDSLALWILGVPIVLLGAYRIYVTPMHWKREIISPIIVCVALLVSKAVLKLIAVSGGFVVPGAGQAMFTEIENIGRNIYSTFYGLLELFNANFFGRPIGSLQTMILLFHFCAMILVFYIFGRIAYQMVKKSENDYTNQLLVISIAVTIAAYLFSNMNLGTDTTRYLIPVVFLGAVLVGRWFNTFEWNPNKNVIVAMVIGFYALSMFSPFSLQRDLNKMDKLQVYLENQGLTNGYASYWLSSPITVYSNAKVKVRQVTATSDEKITPFIFLAEKKWYDSSANFIMYDSSDWGSVNKLTAINTFGKPVKELQFEDVHILVWDKDISKFLIR
ncbi:hypothetical protein [Paenibacillus herberti]|uniref:Glycosyltransferase RgtA/B/C/D-like domain-containing protein n=1 Tax=Paenibacillus herberti TaxID=1619309 RepID=A0A229NWU8_9BACL|nr:hypothetical protein [Paenibacillus herberti]OXM14214.1 hypothetical protein CGZ75_14720 [Paenibacillus herberti]